MGKRKLMAEDRERVDGKPPPISIGLIVGDPHDETKNWSSSAQRISRSVQHHRGNVESPFNLDIVFLISGEFMSVDFEGVRTGRYSRKHNLLMVQIAVPRSSVSTEFERQDVLRKGLLGAIHAGENEALRRKKVSGPLTEIRDIVERAIVALED